MVAVVVLNWNGGEDTLMCLRSVIASDLPGLCVYVADNGSADGSLAHVRAAFPAVRIVENGKNLGFCGGNNRGWRAAASEGARRVLFLNNDAVVAPDTVRLLAEVMDAHPDVGAASPRIFRGGAVGAGGGVWFEKGRVALDRFVVAEHVPADGSERDAPLYDTECVCGCALLIGVETLERVGGFDEAFFAYHEDVDLSLKLGRAGLRCVVVPGARVWHKVHGATGGDLSPTAVFYAFRNGRRLARRHADAAAWRRYRRGFFRAWLSHVAGLSARSPAAGAAALQGGLCALLGQRGMRPAFLPETPFRWAASGARMARRLAAPKG